MFTSNIYLCFLDIKLSLLATDDSSKCDLWLESADGVKLGSFTESSLKNSILTV